MDFAWTSKGLKGSKFGRADPLIWTSLTVAELGYPPFDYNLLNPAILFLAIKRAR